MMMIHKLRVPAFVLMPTLMAVASQSRSQVLRFATALVTSVYHLIESSVTNRHGEFPLLYNAWAMLLPEAWAQAASWGIAINFVLSSGIAKLKVGGLAWMKPHTMRSYLGIYHASRSSPPLSKSLNRFIAKRDWATGAIGVGTILLECLAVPGTLLLPPIWRFLIGAGGMIGMHFGIATVMSGSVGVMFLTSPPSYIAGFGCNAQIGTGPWFTAACLGLLPR
jgi:hypothetical protein